MTTARPESIYLSEFALPVGLKVLDLKETSIFIEILCDLIPLTDRKTAQCYLNIYLYHGIPYSGEAQFVFLLLEI